MKTTEPKQTRFEIRISAHDKVFFERASKISGHKTLASFVTDIVKKQAQAIIEEHEKILASEKDKEIFFRALVANGEPNDRLKKAAQKYLDQPTTA